MKKRSAVLLAGCLALSLAACSPQKSGGQPKETATQPPQAQSQTSTEELLDLFINGSVNAEDPEDPTEVFSLADLNVDAEEWNTYSVGAKVDLDNDGENELILNGPYGGIYLDARDDRVYKFAAGGGTADALSYTRYDGAVWILYSNDMNVGYKAFHMEKFEGADHLAAEIDFGEESSDPGNAEAEIRYTWNGTEISYDEYSRAVSEIFAEQVSAH